MKAEDRTEEGTLQELTRYQNVLQRNSKYF